MIFISRFEKLCNDDRLVLKSGYHEAEVAQKGVAYHKQPSTIALLGGYYHAMIQSCCESGVFLKGNNRLWNVSLVRRESYSNGIVILRSRPISKSQSPQEVPFIFMHSLNARSLIKLSF